MTDQPPKPRRRWKRWIAVSLVVAIVCGAWLASRESETVRQARQVRIGQTKADVERIMGPPAQPGMSFALYATPSEFRWMQFALAVKKVLRRCSLWHEPVGYSFPVQISFDGNDRVNYIRRGSEVVGR
jgi:hypothetical protein